MTVDKPAAAKELLIRVVDLEIEIVHNTSSLNRKGVSK